MAYLDHAAATPLRPGAREVWLATAELVGNASSLHRDGRAVRRVVEESRERLAAALRVPPNTVVFTSGGTESDHLAVVGTARARRDTDPGRRLVLTSGIEHKAVGEAVEGLAREGFQSAAIGVDATGTVDPGTVKDLLRMRGDDVALVAVMAVNNEMGAVQPVAEIAGICADFGVPLHVDAVQAVGTLPLDLQPAATAAVSGHKAGGPFGAGALVVRPGIAVAPLGHAGTLNAPGIAGMAAAVDAAVTGQQGHADGVAGLRDALLRGIVAAVPDAVVNSRPGGHPGIASVTFPGCEGDALMLLLDAAGVSVSTGSACTVGIPQPSHVLLAMGASQRDARAALRFSFGWTSTPQDVEDCLAVLPDAVARARRAGGSDRSS